MPLPSSSRTCASLLFHLLQLVLPILLSYRTCGCDVRELSRAPECPGSLLVQGLLVRGLRRPPPALIACRPRAQVVLAIRRPLVPRRPPRSPPSRMTQPRVRRRVPEVSQALFLLDLGRSPGPLLLVVALPLSPMLELLGLVLVLHVELRLDPLAVCPASFPLGTPQAPSCVLGGLPRAPHGTKGMTVARAPREDTCRVSVVQSSVYAIHEFERGVVRRQGSRRRWLVPSVPASVLFRSRRGTAVALPPPSWAFPPTHPPALFFAATLQFLLQ